MAQTHPLGGLIKWSEREPWRERFLEVMAEHAADACEEAGIGIEEIAGVLGEPVAMMLFGAAFEDFLSRPYGDDGRSMVEEYLKRRGWKEPVPNRRYIEAVRDSVISVYEVSSIVPGESFLARDLIRGGDLLRVGERSATRALKPWDRIAARIVVVNGKTMMTGGTLVLGPRAAEELVEHFTAAPETLREEFRKLAGGTEGMEGADLDGLINDGLVLRMAPEAFTLAWLQESLHRAMHPPKVVNHDGDPIAFHTVRCPLLGTADAVRQRLREHGALREEDDTFWNWIDEGEGPQRRPEGAHVFNSTLEDGATVLGTIELEDDALVLQANSERRAERGQAMLASLLGELVGPPAISTEALDLRKGNNEDDEGNDDPGPGADPMTREYLDQHYRAVLEQPVGMLDNATPRAAAQSPQGRAKLAAWLKFLENQSAANPNPAMNYDFGWMWIELGVADLRI